MFAVPLFPPRIVADQLGRAWDTLPLYNNTVDTQSMITYNKLTEISEVIYYGEI